MGEKTTSNKSSTTAPVKAQVVHCKIVQQKPFQKMGAKITKTITEKIKLSKNCPIKVETYTRTTYATFPSGFFLKHEPIAQFKVLFIMPDATKATVLPNKINQVPPKMPSKARYSPTLEGIMLATKKMMQVSKLISTARIVILLDAFGPKCLVMTSMHIKDNQDIKMPPSRAIQSNCNNVLFANKFIEITLTTNKDTTIAGIDLNSMENSVHSLFNAVLIFCNTFASLIVSKVLN